MREDLHEEWVAELTVRSWTGMREDLHEVVVPLDNLLRKALRETVLRLMRQRSEGACAKKSWRPKAEGGECKCVDDVCQRRLAFFFTVLSSV
jgi:hypothetical protein